MSTKYKNINKTVLALAVCGASTAQAASFQLIEQNASGQGVAYAGVAAVAEDASTIYFNPAGMTKLSGKQIVFAGHIVAPDTTFTNNGSTNALGTALTGTDSSTGEPAFVPNFYYAMDMGNDTYFGVGVNVPFGLTTHYDEGWVGRYHALKSDMMTLNVNPSIAFKVTDKISFGAGISFQYIDLELTNNIDSYGACINLADQSGGAFTGADCVNAGLTGLGIASQDSHVSLSGDSIEMGWNAGILIDLSEKARMGVAYRSTIKHNVKGNADYTLNQSLQNNFVDPFNAALAANPQTSGFSVLTDAPLTAVAELPASLSVSYVGDISDKFTLLLDWTWTEWSTLSEIVIVQQGGIPGQEPKLELGYQDTNRYSAGVHYHHNERLVYRAGVAFDETPIRSPESTSARIPGNDRIWLSLGAGYAPSDNWSFDVAYSHLFIDDTEINNNGGSSSSNATLVGSYESEVNIFSAQVNYNF